MTEWLHSALPAYTFPAISSGISSHRRYPYTAMSRAQMGHIQWHLKYHCTSVYRQLTQDISYTPKHKTATSQKYSFFVRSLMGIFKESNLWGIPHTAPLDKRTFPKGFCNSAYQDTCLYLCTFWYCSKWTGQYQSKYNRLVKQIKTRISKR